VGEPIIIAQWELNRRETLRVELHEFRGTKLLGIRKWFATDNGDLAPGKSGINVNVKHLPKLAEAISDALARANAEGLISEHHSE
jgi:hypothetical protein